MDPLLIGATVSSIAVMALMFVLVSKIGRAHRKSAARVEILRTLAAEGQTGPPQAPHVTDS